MEYFPVLCLQNPLLMRKCGLKRTGADHPHEGFCIDGQRMKLHRGQKRSAVIKYGAILECAVLLQNRDIVKVSFLIENKRVHGKQKGKILRKLRQTCVFRYRIGKIEKSFRSLGIFARMSRTFPPVYCVRILCTVTIDHPTYVSARKSALEQPIRSAP